MIKIAAMSAEKYEFNFGKISRIRERFAVYFECLRNCTRKKNV